LTEVEAGSFHTAVVHHSIPKELDRVHPHWRLTSLLKDADALDRVGIDDLDPRYLRNPEARGMAAFEQWLCDDTTGLVPVGGSTLRSCGRKRCGSP
jgi:hypothetical protein